MRRTILIRLALPLVMGAAVFGGQAITSDVAYAQGAEDPGARARREFAEGERAFKRGDFRLAASQFEKAYRASPHPSALWNAARAWIRATEDVRAANLLERYLKEAPANAPDRDRATEAVAVLDKRLGRIEVQTNDVTDVKIDGEPLTAERLWVTPGEHVATADSHGTTVRKVVTVAAGDRLSVMLDPPPPPPTAAVDARTPPPEPPPSKSLPSWVVWTGLTGTVIAGGLTVASGIDTLSKRDDFYAKANDDTLRTAKDSQLRTNILIGVTAGIAVLTAFAALFVDWSGSKSAHATGTLRAPPFGHAHGSAGISFGTSTGSNAR